MKHVSDLSGSKRRCEAMKAAIYYGPGDVRQIIDYVLHPIHNPARFPVPHERPPLHRPP